MGKVFGQFRDVIDDDGQTIRSVMLYGNWRGGIVGGAILEFWVAVFESRECFCGGDGGYFGLNAGRDVRSGVFESSDGFGKFPTDAPPERKGAPMLKRRIGQRGGGLPRSDRPGRYVMTDRLQHEQTLTLTQLIVKRRKQNQ